MSAIEYEIVLVSGKGNETDQVKQAHHVAKKAWEMPGVDIVTTVINPDYKNGNFDETIAEIRAAKKSALGRGRRVTKVGSSGGGSLILAEEILDLEGGQPGRNVIICTRTDLVGSPSDFSPILVRAVSLIGQHKGTFPFNEDNTLCFTAGEADDVISSASSVLPHARIVPVVGKRIISHAAAVGAVLYSPQHQQVIANFARGGN